jgi:hypothetical protein
LQNAGNGDGLNEYPEVKNSGDGLLFHNLARIAECFGAKVAHSDQEWPQ